MFLITSVTRITSRQTSLKSVYLSISSCCSLMRAISSVTSVSMFRQSSYSRYTLFILERASLSPSDILNSFIRKLPNPFLTDFSKMRFCDVFSQSIILLFCVILLLSVSSSRASLNDLKKLPCCSMRNAFSLVVYFSREAALLILLMVTFCNRLMPYFEVEFFFRTSQISWKAFSTF